NIDQVGGISMRILPGPIGLGISNVPVYHFCPFWYLSPSQVKWFDMFAPGDTGVVQGWAALVMGVLAGSVPWYTMMVLHKRSKLLQRVDDTLGVIHTHGVAGLLGGVLTGLFAEPN
uniref:Ammonium transporter AmtB-like domain-containing protein n=1 Tax=Aegilops tauschii subsp. strangulata TaxID=200361 RepID=A0A453MEG1_AEGTS